MESNVLFSCGYKPVGQEKDSTLSCGKMLLIGGFLAVFFIISAVKGRVLMLLFLLMFIPITIESLKNSSLNQFVHVTPTALQVVRSDGKVLEEYLLKNIREVYASDRDTVKIMVWSEQCHAAVEETLRFVADTDGLVAAVKKYGRVGNSGSNMMIPGISQVMTPGISQRIPLQPHVFAEEEADKLHAAQHLLNQGMISQQQFDGLLMPPQAAQQPDLSEQNADDYFRRQELLAQQIGSAPACRKEEQQETVLREES